MDTNTTVEIMLFEGGCLIDALSDKPLAVTLADRIASEDRKAMADGRLSFPLTLDPIEVGMALSALTSGQSSLAQDLGEKVRKALAAKLDELGINRGGTGTPNAASGLTETPTPAPAGDDQAAPVDASAEAPATDSTSQSSDAPTDGQPATDTDAPPADDNNEYQPL